MSSWRACLEGRRRADGPLADLLRDLLDRHAAGTAPEDLDAGLDDRLCEAVAPPLVDEVEREVEASLEPFRSRMPEAALRHTRRRTVVDRLRRRLGLDRVAKPRQKSVE